jgi:hypothetical protein
MIVGKNEKSNWTKIGLIDPIFCTFKFGSLTRPIKEMKARFVKRERERERERC